MVWGDLSYNRLLAVNIEIEYFSRFRCIYRWRESLQCFIQACQQRRVFLRAGEASTSPENGRISRAWHVRAR